MKPTLQVRQSQHLALTPQLQQSIQLLQLSTLELAQEVERMLEQNPFLEVDDETHADESAHGRLAAEEGERYAEGDQTDMRFEATSDSDEAAAGIDNVDLGTIGQVDWDAGIEHGEFDGIADASIEQRGSGRGAEDLDGQDRGGAQESLREHLQGQLRGMRLGPDDAAAVNALIDSLDEDGYLRDSLEEIAEQLAGDDDALQGELLDRLRCALKWLQGLEPLGVGARSLSECLTLQLRVLPRSEVQMIAIHICKQHLDLLAQRDVKKLMAATGADAELLHRTQGLIVSLEPKPGRRFACAESSTVVPDVIVQKVDRGWKALINPDVVPNLRINSTYAQAIPGNRGARGTPLSARLQEARWFVKNVKQRFDTIQRVAQAVVDRQRNFFTHGAIAMRPLVLREVADALGVHESTVSRVTTAKYMATIFGTYELKYFFCSSLGTDAGGNASSTAVRALIAQLVAAENRARPLSDATLSLMLEEQGIRVARRTVAKYREALRISPVSLRKSF